jgi:hypothetical protein
MHSVKNGRGQQRWKAWLTPFFAPGLGGAEPAMIVLDAGKREFLRIFKPLPGCEGHLQNDSY